MILLSSCLVFLNLIFFSELIGGNADLAIGALTINFAREAVIGKW